MISPKRQSKTQRGFTLFEMMVVITIMGILIVLFISRYQSGQDSTRLQLAAQQLISNIRLAQSMAISGVEPAVQSKVGGYAIMFNPHSPFDSFISYSLYLNTATNDPIYGCPSGIWALQNTYEFPAGINVDITGMSCASGCPFIMYAPPEPRTCIDNGTAWQQDNMTITLKSTSGKSMKVFVDRYGKVEIQ